MEDVQLLGPVFELLNGAAPRGAIDHRSYDRAQLALRLIDYIRAQSGQPGGIGQSSSAQQNEIGAPPDQIEAHYAFLRRAVNDPTVMVALFHNTQYIAGPC